MAAVGVCGVLAAEAVSLLVSESRSMSWLSGAALATALIAVRWSVGRRVTPGRPTRGADETGTTIKRWVEQAEAQIAWSDSTRSDWDRRLRPVLARQFEIATRQPRSRNPIAFANTGRIHFGDDLWRWVDPDNISRTRTRTQERGPGREVFVHIIERLERL